MNFKNKIILFTSTLSITGPLYAKPFDELVNTLKSVNKEAKVTCSEVEMEFEDLAELCAIQVCGPAENYQNSVHTGNGDKYLHPEAKIQIDGLEQEFKKREKTLEIYTKFVIQKQNELKNIINPALISDDDAMRILSNIVLAIKRSKEFDEDPTPVLNDRINLKVPISSQYARIYADVISKIDLKNNIHFAAISGVEVDEKKIYDNYVKNTKKLKSEIKKNKLSSNYDFDKELNLLKKNGKAHATIFNTKLLKEAKSLGVQLQGPICSTDCKKSILNISQNETYFDANSLKALAKERFNREDALAECRSTIYLENINVRNSQEIENQWPKLISRFKSNTTLSFSTHSKNLLLKSINEKLKLHFKKDLTKPQLYFPETSDIENAMTDNSFSQMFNTATNEQLFQEYVQEPRCYNNNRESIITDRFNEKDLTIEVSPFSCEHPLQGIQILSHELGHAVSYLINNTKNMSKETKNNFIKLRKCSTSEKESNPNPASTDMEEFHYPEDLYTSEEDTADLFSHALSIDNKNFSECSVISNGENYYGISLNHEDNDTHSSSIIRLMVELQYKNPAKITQTCAEVIKRTKSKITKRCY